MFFQCPGRTPWASNSLSNILGNSITVGESESFTKYVSSLNRDYTGWVDLFVCPK